MRITHRLHEVMSGAPLSIPITATGSWNTSLTSVGNGRFDISLANTPFSREQWQQSTMHWFHMIAEYWDGHPMFFGLIADKWFGFDSETLTLETVTVDDLFDNRYTFGVANYDDGDFSIESQSMRAAMVQTLKRGTQWGGWWGLPLVYRTPEVEAGGFTQSWERHDWKRISDIIDIIRKQENGPDLAFVPAVDAGGSARWDVYAGDPKIPGPTIDLPVSVKNSHARNVRLGERGRGMLSGTFVRGEGLGKNRPFGSAGFADGPAMAVRDAARDMVANDANLTSIAAGDLGRNRRAVEQYEFDLVLGDAENPFPIADLRLGTRFNFRHSGNAYRGPEQRTLYTAALSHSTQNPNIVSPEVQPL